MRFALALAAATTSAASAQDFCGEWGQVPSPTFAGTEMLRDIDVYSPDLAWAVGWHMVNGDMYSVTLRWDGEEWSHIPSPSPGIGPSVDLRGVDVIAPDDVWAVGSYVTTGANGNVGSQTFAMHFDGDSWSQVDTPLTPPNSSGGFMNDVFAVSSDLVYAVGSMAGGPGNFGPGATLFCWDGSDWEQVSQVEPIEDKHRFWTLYAFGEDDVWAAGTIDLIINQGTLPLVAHWNGSSWDVQDVPEEAFVHRIRAMDATSPTDMWFAGQLQFLGVNGFRSLLMHFDGESFEYADGLALPDGEMMDISIVGEGDVWAGGTYLAHFNGDAWATTPIPAGNAFVRSLDTVGECDVWAAGSASGASETLTARLTPGDSCDADFNGDGLLNILDFVAYQNAFTAGDPGADCNDDGELDILDFVCFQNLFTIGCI